MAAIYGPQAPKKKALAKGPIQPAFPVEAYAMPGGPWSSLLAGSIPKPGGSPEDIMPLVERTPPRTFQNTGSAENVFAPENIDLEGGLDPQLKQNYLQKMSIGNRVGESAESKMQAAQEAAKTRKIDTYMSPEDKGILDLITENSPAMQRVRADIDARKALGDQYQAMVGSRKAGVDLSPLMALTDAWTGSKFAQSYKAPENPMDRFKDVLAYKDKISDDEQKFADAVNKGSQYLKSGSLTDMSKNGLLEMLGYGLKNLDPNARKGRDRPAAIEEKWMIDKANKIHNDYQTDFEQISRLKDNLARGDFQGLQISLGYASRQLGGQKGVLTDKDVAMTMPATIGGSLAKLEAYFTNNPNVALTPDLIKGLNDLADIAAKRLSDKYQMEFGTFKKSIAGSSMGGLSNVLTPYEASFKNNPLIKGIEEKEASKKVEKDKHDQFMRRLEGAILNGK